MKSIESILWDEIASHLSLQAGMLVLARGGGNELKCSLVSAYRLPIEPFNGSENYSVRDVVKEILSTNSKPHEHGIKKFALSNLVKRHGKDCQVSANVIFTEQMSVAGKFIFLGFPKDSIRDSTRAQKVVNAIAPLIQFVSQESKLSFYEATLDFTERYMREIGHDLASCTQAIFAQLTFMRDGEISLSASRQKAGSILREVRNFYAIAESLNFTLDRDYHVQSRERISIGSLSRDVAEQYEAEAREKGISIDCSKADTDLYVYGERAAIRQCIIHLVVNGIKYSFDNTTVIVRTRREQGEVHLIVSNRGVALPQGIEESRIWDFGYRSEYAKERHVNGSGIGLFTAKKVVIAHGGRIWCEQGSGETRFIIAFPIR